MRRKSLSEKDIRTILAVIECYREQNHNRFDEMNRHMGSITIEEMIELNTKLYRWYNNMTWDPEEDGDHYDEQPFYAENPHLDYEPVDENGIYY